MYEECVVFVKAVVIRDKFFLEILFLSLEKNPNRRQNTHHLL